MSTENSAAGKAAPETTASATATPGNAPAETQGGGQAREERRPDPVRRVTALVLLICLLLVFWHILADRFTPYTANARIDAFVVPIVPQVSGLLVSMEVENNQYVEAGTVLARIDPARYELAVRKAQADLQKATQNSEADIAAVSAAQAKVAVARANLRNAEIKGQRIIRLASLGAASKSRADDARSKIEANRARLDQALSDLEKARAKLGGSGQDNASIKAALSALETAQLDLSRTVLRAPSDGVITNLTVDVGQYAGAGTPIMTFISTRNVWIQANMRENCLGNIDREDPVDLVLDARPGRVFKGRVMSIGYGVADGGSGGPGSLATVQTSSGWLRQAQLMPVLLRFENLREVKGLLRVGGQVNVVIYTGEHRLLNPVAWLWIRLISWLSYLY